MRSPVRIAALFTVLLALLATPILAEVVVEVRGAGLPARPQTDVPPKILGSFASKVLPFYRSATDSDQPAEVTLYAVRNNTPDPLSLNFTYYESQDGVAALVEQVDLDPFAVRNVDMRSIQGLPADDDGVTSGYLLVEPLASGLPENAVSGDYFRADPGGKSVNGGLMIPAENTDCRSWSHRFLSGGAFSGGTRISFLVLDAPPNGPVAEGNVYDEAGELVSVVSVTSDEAAFEIDESELDLPVSFGSIDWFFQGNATGVITPTFTASGLRSVGTEASCIDEVGGEPLPEGSEVFELQGEFLTCRGCTNWQYDMPFGGQRTFSKIVLDFDVFINEWDPSRTSGFHCLFWLNNGNQWQDMLGYLNSKGTQGRVTFQVNGPLGSPIGVEARATPGFQKGQKYQIHYEYDTVEKVVWFEARTTSGELWVSKTIQLPPSTGPVNTKYMFIQFGHQEGHVESETPRWRWSDFRAVFIP